MIEAGAAVQVKKLAHDGREVFGWEGTVRALTADHIDIDAHFNRPTVDLGYVVFAPGDLFRERYYFHRWYNIYEIQGPSGNHKGWYCNIGSPAEIRGDTVVYADLALDLFVFPNREYLVLDEEEFAELARTVLPRETTRLARAGLADLIRRVEAGEEPFAR